MSVVSKGFAAQGTFAALCSDIRRGVLPAAATGLGGIHKTLLADALVETLGRKVVYLVPEEADAARMQEDLQALGRRVLYYPARDLALRRAESVSREYEQMRIGTLTHLLEGDYDCLITCVEALTQYTVPPEVLRRRSLRIEAGRDMPEKRLLPV